jgi:dihydroflavonol-4-reductase
MVPNLCFACVDVRDVAALHLAALENKETAGQRILAAAETLWFKDIAQTLKDSAPSRKISTRVAPTVLIKLLGLFDPAIRGIIPQLGKPQPIDNARAKALLGRDLLSPREAAQEAGQFLIAEGLV